MVTVQSLPHSNGRDHHDQLRPQGDVQRSTASVIPSPSPPPAASAPLGDAAFTFPAPPAVPSTAPSGLKVMVSEGLMEASTWLVTALAQKHDIICRDFPLEDPIAIIIDTHTALMLLTEDIVSSKEVLKAVVKQMTKIAFKFRVLWILNIEPEVVPEPVQIQTGYASSSSSSSSTNGPQGLILGLIQSLSQFPCRTILRHCSSEGLVDLIATACHDAAEEAWLNGVSLQNYTDRPIFNALERGREFSLNTNMNTNMNMNMNLDRFHLTRPLPVLPQHCQYLQLYPTVNYYLAAELLINWPLHTLANLSQDQLLNETGMTLSYDPALKDMWSLMHRHIGLRASNVNTATATATAARTSNPSTVSPSPDATSVTTSISSYTTTTKNGRRKFQNVDGMYGW